MFGLFLDDQSPPDERADHPGGGTFFYRKDIVELRQLNDSSSRNTVKDEELGKSQVQAKSFLLLTAAQSPGKLSDEGKDFLVRLRHGHRHSCILQPSFQPVKNFFRL
jgi:hypothetical protein